MTALPKTAAVAGTTARRVPGPSRTWRCQSSGRVMVREVVVVGGAGEVEAGEEAIVVVDRLELGGRETAGLGSRLLEVTAVLEAGEARGCIFEKEEAAEQRASSLSRPSPCERRSLCFFGWRAVEESVNARSTPEFVSFSFVFFWNQTLALASLSKETTDLRALFEREGKLAHFSTISAVATETQRA